MKYDSLCVSAIRALVIDTINRSNSGHPGMALDSAPLLYTLYSRFMNADPSDPTWIGRDRFVLSAGHASALLYSVLHLAGYRVSLDDMKSFRQLDSKTPGHPEYGVTEGVDCGAGPLGQGFAQAVGMALAETHLRGMYPGSEKIFGHYTYCLVGDGCVEEGVAFEAAALAGKLKLNRLIAFYDNNQSTLDGPSSWTLECDVGARFKALGWNFIHVEDGNDIEALSSAIEAARKSDRPTLIQMDTLIGYGSFKQGDHSTHGSPLGLEDGEHAKEVYGWTYPPFEIPDQVYETFRETFLARGKKARESWNEEWKRYSNEHPEEAFQIELSLRNDTSYLVFDKGPSELEGKPLATRDISQSLLNLVQEELPFLIGGTADLESSVKTKIKGAVDYSPEHPEGTVIRYGIREFAMAAIANGIALHGGLRTYCGTFLVFSDYLKAAIRMSALQKLPVVYLLSHDSIAVGEDGPTHEPVEQLAMLRSIPELRVFRPADLTECAAAYREAFTAKDHPTAIILSRQKLAVLSDSSMGGTLRGGYVVSKEKEKGSLTLLASGSEVGLCIEAQTKLLEGGIDTRVVSVPDLTAFLNQGRDYVEKTIGNPRDRRLYVEMASPYGPSALADETMCISSFGYSAPADKVLERMGFTVDNVVSRVKSILESRGERS